MFIVHIKGAPTEMFLVPGDCFHHKQTHNGLATIENAYTIDESRSENVRNVVFGCHLSPNWRQMAIENTVSSEF